MDWLDSVDTSLRFSMNFFPRTTLTPATKFIADPHQPLPSAAWPSQNGLRLILLLASSDFN
jgi:hypothetical protein